MSWTVTVALSLLGFVTGCGAQRPQDVWAMPDMRGEPTPTAAREAYPFGTPGRGVAGGDATDAEEVGDLPEEAYFSNEDGFWRRNEDHARQEAKRTGKGLLVSFWADWSEECAQLDEDTLRDPRVRAAMLGDYVPLRIDVSEESHAGRGQLDRFRVDHVPAIILLDDEGRELDRIEAYISEEMMLERLHKRR